ncbi:transcription termination factor MTERF8, chloroplastic-like [Curcuma longa]|uniref:transcription termination factor MTERF8, chloroplastic-like n=1 Tax=Curcuma longa TaxID=136217 RepID=UPI003D9ED31C
MTASALRFTLRGLNLPRLSPAIGGGSRTSVCLPAPTTDLRSHLCIARAATNGSPLALSFLRELHLDENEAEALLLAHPELDLAPLPSLRGRVLALRSLGISGLELSRTVARRPDVLSQPEFGPFLDFALHELKGIEPAKLEQILTGIPLQFLEGIVGGSTMLLDHGVPSEKLGHVLNHVHVRKVFCERPLRDLEQTVLFLKQYGWPELVLRRPMLLNLDLHSQLIPRVEFLIELGGGDAAAVRVLLSKLPALLSYTVEHYESHLVFWRSVGISNEELFKIAMVYPKIFSVSKERKLEPRIEFLKQCNMDAVDIFKFLVKAPLFMSLSFEENLSKKLNFLAKIGYKHRTRELAWAFGATTRTSCENMQRLIGLFLSYGFSCEDIVAMSKKHPQVLQYNHESLEKKMEFLVEEMERDIRELLVFPAFLGYKLDERIKRRYATKKKIGGKEMPLTLLSLSTERFH